MITLWASPSDPFFRTPPRPLSQPLVPQVAGAEIPARHLFKTRRLGKFFRSDLVFSPSRRVFFGGMMLRPVPGAAGGDGQPWGENGVEFGLVNNFKLIFNWGGVKWK